MIKRFLSILLIVLVASNALASSDSTYLQSNEVPNPIAYLPPPPDSASTIFTGDYARWIWGKSLRNTPRGEQASWESKFGIVRMCTIYSDVLGIDISEENTPAIYKLMNRSGHTGASSVARMKNEYFRKRPFVLMKESVWGQYDYFDNLEFNSSYPSSHTSYGWGTALALAEMAPHMQDTILNRGYEYGISRVIVGAHWQSDVDAAILCSSAAIARSHATQEFQADLIAAREEYALVKGLTLEEVTTANSPQANKIIPGPYQTNSQPYIGDLSLYWSAKAERDSERGAIAIADASLDDNAIMSGFASCVDIPLSSAETPSISLLLKMLKLRLGLDASVMKNYWFRKRPYVQMGAPTAIPGEEAEYYNDSSYPSGHATIGWGIALILAEVMPECQNALLKRGYDFGWSRVIVGYHYPSDIQAGMLMAACLLTRYHNDASFVSLLNAAKQEYAQKKAAQQGTNNDIDE